MGCWRRLTAWGNQYFKRGWPVIPYQPILALFLWGVAIRLSFSPNAPPDFEAQISDGAYRIWLGLGIVFPPLAALSWWLIEKRDGIWRYRGMWFRLSADIALFTMVFAYHITVVTTVPATEARIFSRYIVGATLLFLIGLVIRDVWSLALTEKMAKHIRRQSRDE